MLPYLPDVLGRGISLVFQEAGRDRIIPFPFGTEGFTARYRERLARAPAVPARARRSRLAAGRARRSGPSASPCPPGDVQRFRLASSLDRADLDLFGPWRSLPPAVRSNEDVAEAAADGWLWASHAVRGGHARPRRPAPARGAAADGGGRPATGEGPPTRPPRRRRRPRPEHGADHGRGPVDRPDRRPEPARARRADDAGGRVHDPDPGERGPGRPLRRRRRRGRPFPEQGRSGSTRPSTRLGDTATARSTTASAPRPASASTSHLATARTRAAAARQARRRRPERGRARRSRSRCRARRGHPRRSSTPCCRCSAGTEGTEPEQPVATRRSAGPACGSTSSGRGTRPARASSSGVLLAPAANDTRPMRHPVSQWGADPVWLSAPVARRAMFLELDDLLRALGIDDRPGDALPSCRRRRIRSARCRRPAGDGARLPARSSARPAGCGTSTSRSTPAARSGRSFASRSPATSRTHRRLPPLGASAVRLRPAPPERTTSVSRTDVRHVRVVMSGPIGIREPASGGGATTAVPTTRQLRRLGPDAPGRRRAPSAPRPGDPDRPQVGDGRDEDLPVRGFGRNVYEAAWVGELEAPEDIPLRTPARTATGGSRRGVGAPARRPRGSRRCPLAPRLGAAADLRRRDRALVTAARKNRRWSSESVDAESDGGRHGGTRPGRTSGTCDFFLTRTRAR